MTKNIGKVESILIPVIVLLYACCQVAAVQIGGAFGYLIVFATSLLVLSVGINYGVVRDHDQDN